eukprot:TRINITY_DN2267_c0_g2_i1.p1 TRINITY_DN2267_c0_g2~~TRINITY_DN2267_c0_g2_i1.p1  ORF type:complete len:128 (-),score=61.04 TRINITY_DN2267_c0_g2_i1:101-454(-)
MGVDDWLEDRRALLEQDSELENMDVCKDQKSSWKSWLSQLVNFNLQVSFKGHLGVGWLAEASYKLTYGSEAIEGSLRVDIKSVNAAKQIMEAAWQKLKEQLKGKARGLVRFISDKLW